MEIPTTTTTVTIDTDSLWAQHQDLTRRQKEDGGWDAVCDQSDVAMSEEAYDNPTYNLSSGGSSNPSVRDHDPNHESSMVIATKARLSSSYYFLCQLGAASFGFVYAIISRDLADSIIAGLSHGMPKNVVHGLLRRNTLAVKIASAHYFGPRTVTKDMSREIETMKKAGTIENIIRMVNYDQVGRRWFSMPFVEGCTLGDFAKRFCDPESQYSADLDVQVSKAVTFHLLAQLAEAVLLLHDKDITHGDLHARNIMLSKATKHDDYPAITIVDFGCARSWDPEDTRGHSSADWKDARFRVEKYDAFFVLDAFVGLADHSGEKLFFRSASSRVARTHNSEELHATWRDIAYEARQKVMSLQQPMPAAVDGWLSTSSISAGDLEQVIRAIRGHQ